ncbi:hypothetical protein JRQ81_006299 [Phrynocephalus forsythii]|uniref:Uncharacterized protein n=1 Tax=Phrynocephalus forsythii TaxID=171643 RepID=A0A9Q0XF53_9SAUR|nr:hypothetical protein JRQ81_006299 [Phrynocephalus forsythii]
MAILNDGSLGSSQPHDYRTQDSCRPMIESSMCGAVNCLTIHGPDPTDQPKDLKGNSILHSSKPAAYDFSNKEETHDLLSNQKPNTQGNYTEKFVRPVEETVQHELANRTSKRDTQPFMKLRATGGDRQDVTDLYSASGLSCTSMAIRLGLPTEDKLE